MARKNTICLWYDGAAMDAARFYAETFPDSAVGAVMRAPGDYPDGKQGDVLTVEFTVIGIPCVGLNGGPQFKHNEAFSFQIATDNQAETDRLWNAIVRNGGQESDDDANSGRRGTHVSFTVVGHWTQPPLPGVAPSVVRPGPMIAEAGRRFRGLDWASLAAPRLVRVS